jgi:hypothetical protein
MGALAERLERLESNVAPLLAAHMAANLTTDDDH